MIEKKRESGKERKRIDDMQNRDRRLSRETAGGRREVSSLSRSGFDGQRVTVTPFAGKQMVPTCEMREREVDRRDERDLIKIHIKLESILQKGM